MTTNTNSKTLNNISTMKEDTAVWCDENVKIVCVSPLHCMQKSRNTWRISLVSISNKTIMYHTNIGHTSVQIDRGTMDNSSKILPFKNHFADNLPNNFIRQNRF